MDIFINLLAKTLSPASYLSSLKRRLTPISTRKSPMNVTALTLKQSVAYTVLAVWQAVTTMHRSSQSLLRLSNVRSIIVFVYNAALSVGVSFNSKTTTNADLFASSYLPGQLAKGKSDAGEEHLI